MRVEGGSENEKWVLLSTRFPADRHSRFFPVSQSRGEGYSEVRGERGRGGGRKASIWPQAGRHVLSERNESREKRRGEGLGE